MKTNKAIWWSPVGSLISFASFDDTKVDAISYPKYGTYDDPNNVYPELVTLRYPKTGRENPSVALWVADLRAANGPTARRLMPPNEVFGRYVTYVT